MAMAHAQSDQSEALIFLDRPENYGLPGATATRIDTHISAVFLAGDEVLKLKKAVDFGYLDFSTLEKREWACRREVVLNRRTAPDLYRGVVPLTRESDGRLTLGGRGEAVEWLVRMRRFDGARLGSLLAERGLLSAEEVALLAARVAAFHDSLPPSAGGGMAGAAEVLALNEARLGDHVPALFAPEAIRELIGQTRAELERRAPLLDGRASAGFVRLAHGDLHLGNVVFEEKTGPLIFDGIEFSDSIATVDVLYDLAFLLMDLLQRGLRLHANRAFNAYLLAASDPLRAASLAGLAALPLFQSLRAGVRAHVSASMGNGDLAKNYVRAAGAFLSPQPARLVAVGGHSGSGKSTLARTLAPSLGPDPGAVHLRSDELRKRLWGCGQQERLPKAAYAPEVTERVYAQMRGEALEALRAGQGVLLDAVHAQPEERSALQELSNAAGVPFLGLWLDAPPAALHARVGSRKGDASDADAAVVDRQLGYDTGAIAWRRIDASGSAEETAGRALATLRKED